MKKHILKVHSMDKGSAVRPFRCRKCGKEFVLKDSFRKHMDRHAKDKEMGRKVNRNKGGDKERTFKCQHEGCHQAFYQRSDLKRHQVVHSGEKGFECSVCGKKYSQIGCLYRHIRTQHEGFAPRSCAARLNDND